MLYMEIITDYFKYHAQLISTMCGKMQKFLMLCHQVYTYLPLRFKGLKINLQICTCVKKCGCAWPENYKAHSWG
jgi:hypothetical protein